MYSRERIDWDVVLMGLFDMFKKKKEETSEVVTNNEPVQVQNADSQVVDNATQVMPVASQADVSVASQPTVFEPVAQPEVAVSTPVDTMSSSMASFDVPNINNVDVNMNQVVNNETPAQVTQVTTDEQKTASIDIVPNMEDVAALIDNPIPAKSEEENMTVNPKSVIDNTADVSWQDNPFKDDTDNIMDNLVSNDSNVISTNEPMTTQGFEPFNKEDEIQNLSDTSKMNVIDASSIFDALSNDSEDNSVEDPVIKVEDESDNVENSNIFKTEAVLENNNGVDDDFFPIVVEEDDSKKSDVEDSVPDSTVELVDLVDEVAAVSDEAVNENTISLERKDLEIASEAKEKTPISSFEEETKEEEKKADEVQEIVEPTEEIEEASTLPEEIKEELLEEKDEKESTSEEPIVVEEVEAIKEEPKEVIEEFVGPVIEEEKLFTIFDLPPIGEEYEAFVDDEEDIAQSEEKSNKEIVVEEEEAPKSIEGKEESKGEKTEDISDMYSQLDFRNDKIKFCENCGAMIIGEMTTVCPSCGEPL